MAIKTPSTNTNTKDPSASKSKTSPPKTMAEAQQTTGKPAETKQPGTCCMSNSNKPGEALNLQAPKPQNSIGTSQSKTGKLTRIVAEFDVGFGNMLYIRGKGANLSWEKGLPMRNAKANEWIWESDAVFPTGEFKILVNDSIYETGHNHALYCGTTVRHTPRF